MSYLIEELTHRISRAELERKQMEIKYNDEIQQLNVRHILCVVQKFWCPNFDTQKCSISLFLKASSCYRISSDVSKTPAQ